MLGFLASLDPIVLALIGTLFGGSGLKAVEWLLSKRARADTTAADLRKELRGDVTTLRAELKHAEAAVDTWQEKYWDLYEEVAQVKAGQRLNAYKINAVIEDAPNSPALNELKALPDQPTTPS